MKSKFCLGDKISASVKRLSPYAPGEQPSDSGWIKLNTNELPYPPSPRVREAVIEAMGADGGMLRLYPDPSSSSLRRAAAEYYGLGAEYAFAANGSDDALNLAAGDSASTPWPGYARAVREWCSSTRPTRPSRARPRFRS